MAQKITVTFALSDQFLRDVICTAVEGGSTYWARFKTLSTYGGEFGLEYQSVRLQEIDESTGKVVSTHVVTLESMAVGVQRALMCAGVGKPHEQMHADHIAMLMRACLENDGGHVDADLADCVMQFATLGKIVYG